MNYHKDKENAPILVKNPFSGQWVNVMPLFAVLNEKAEQDSPNQSFAYFSDLLDKSVIRFINESCIISEGSGMEAHDMFYVLYFLKDMFGDMVNIKP